MSCTEVDIKSPGNAKKRVQRRAESYLLKKMSLLRIFACTLYINLYSKSSIYVFTRRDFEIFGVSNILIWKRKKGE